MIVLSGAALVLPDRVLSPGTLVVDGERIAEVRSDAPTPGSPSLFAFSGYYIVPGFVDVHMHGLHGVDTLDNGDPVAAIAERLPQYGVTSFCPTTVACAPGALRRVLDAVRRARETPSAGSARVLPAHLESNFVNPEYRGAQPAACLRSPRAALAGVSGRSGEAGATGETRLRPTRAEDMGIRGEGSASVRPGGGAPAPVEKSWPGSEAEAGEDFEASDILDEITRATPDVGIVTLAPELDNGPDLIKWLASRGHRVSLGHSAATYEEAQAGIAAGALQATHLFNRMPPLNHRAPGLVGAILESEAIAAEIVCDGFHVHPALVQAVVSAKGPARVMAITDATAAAGMPAGARSRLGGRSITAGPDVARLDDGTVAGSVLTMDRAFQMLAGRIGLSLVDAATLCATTPARELGLVGYGVIAPGAAADLVVLDANLCVIQTYIGGRLVYARNSTESATV
jgi:N-acetylglucosamine-6-phosphate deacetylase